MQENPFSKELLGQIRAVLELPELWLHISENWGSTQAGHRKLIREAINVLASENLKSQALATQDLSFSISHCPRAGGFAITVAPHQIGFDMEEMDRVKPDVMGRISTPSEMQLAPGPTLLWTAKEAAFKALLGHHQPAIVSAMQVYDWQKLGDHVWRWSAKNSLKEGSTLRGCSVQLPSVNISIATPLSLLSRPSLGSI